jgi:hypothetical protein
MIAVRANDVALPVGGPDCAHGTARMEIAHPYFVVEGSVVVYRCRTLAEGHAFLAGRPRGVLGRVLGWGADFDPSQFRPISRNELEKSPTERQKTS